MTRRWVCIAAAALVCLITLSAAAPVVKDEKVEVTAAEKPLVRTKRADEIIYNGQQEADGIRIKKAENTAKTDDVIAKVDDVSKSAADADSKPSKATPADDVMVSTENGEQEISPSDKESDVAYDSTESEKQSAYDNADNDGGRDSDEGDEYGSDQRRRRRAAASNAAVSKENNGRQERSAGHPVVAMVAENMAAPAVSSALGGARLQRAKRELDADTIRELIESRQQVPSDVERPAYDYNDYGTTGGEYVFEPNPEEISVDAGESALDGTEEAPYVEGDNVDDYFTEDDRRPKRQDDDSEQAEEEEAEEEEAYEEAEREVIRELLAERVAEETRQALLAYLSGGGQNMIGNRESSYRSGDRFDQDDVSDEDEETSYAEGEGDEGPTDEEDQLSEDDGDSQSSEEIDEDDDRLDNGPFLPNEGPELMAKSSIKQKRFAYPYTYEPYGGRWGALVPGAKRSDRDPYDRLYRLAEALSRPAALSQDEYKK